MRMLVGTGLFEAGGLAVTRGSPTPARLTYPGSNFYQSRVVCSDCGKTLMLLYHSLPEAIVQHVLDWRNRSRHSDDEDNPYGEGVTDALDVGIGRCRWLLRAALQAWHRFAVRSRSVAQCSAALLDQHFGK